MFKHDLKVGWRNILKYKLQSVICLMGLALGLSCFAWCSNLLRNQLAWNRGLPYIDCTYYIAYSNTDQQQYPFNSPYLNRMIKSGFPEIEKSVAYLEIGGYTDKVCRIRQESGQETWQEVSFLYVDSSFMDYYDFSLLRGDWEKIKSQADACVLTPSVARRLFGTIDVIGYTFDEVRDDEEESKTYIVTGLIPEFPTQTDFDRLGGLVFNSSGNELEEGKYYRYPEIRFRLKSGCTAKELEKKIRKYVQKYPDILEERITALQVLPYREFWKSIHRNNYWSYPLILAGIGLMVLLAAVFNYLLFLSGRLLNRQKEYGVRRITGANGWAIFRMFAVEIAIIIGGALLLSLMLLEVAPSVFPAEILENINKSVFVCYLIEYTLIVWLVVLLVCRIFLMRIRRKTLVTDLQGGGSIFHKSLMQKLLLGMQLFICILLMGGTYYLYAQQKYLQKRMGGTLTWEEKRNIYSYNLTNDKLYAIRYEFQKMLEENPYIEDICTCGMPLFKYWNIYPEMYRIEGKEPSTNEIITYQHVGANYADFIHARIEQGRFFREGEENGAVVNRAFANMLGRNPIGCSIFVHSWGKIHTYTVVGIMEDWIPMEKNPLVKPCMFLPYPDEQPNVVYYVKLKPGTDFRKLQPLEEKMRAQVTPLTDLGIINLEKEAEDSDTDLRLVEFLLFLFTLICVVISLLGVYSSMVLTVERKRKEMAIRKINGATLSDIARIFVRHYLCLLGVAAMVALPTLFIGVSVWLENYTYHFHLTPWPFIVIFVVLFLIILLTIGSQLLKIIHINPAERLKSE